MRYLSSFAHKFNLKRNQIFLKVRSDHGGEFENEPFENFCENYGIIHEFSSPRTPHQNGVVKRKNKYLQEMARIMVHENHLPKYLWVEAVNTSCYVQNKRHMNYLK